MRADGLSLDVAPFVAVIEFAAGPDASSLPWHNVAQPATLIPCPTITPSASRQGHGHDSPRTRGALACLSGRSPSDIAKRASGTTHTR
jgi:hypothetical protein